MREVGGVFDINRKTVASVLKKAGVPLRQRGLTDEQIDSAAKLYLEGLSLAGIAERFSVSAGTVHRRLREAGVQMRTSYDHLLDERR